MENNYPIGPKTWSERLRRLLPWQSKFRKAAIAHDWLYEYGGSEYDRQTADLAFLELCLEECDSPLWGILAFLYFCAVRSGGKKHFRYSKSE